MANNPFDRVLINLRERPLSPDHNQLQSEIDRTIREVLDRLMLPRATSASDISLGTPRTGFIGDGFKVRPMNPASMQVQVTPGLGFFVDATDTPSSIGGVASVDDLSRFKPLYLPTAALLSIPAADATNPRLDIIEVRHNRGITDTASRDVLNPVTGQFVPTSVQKTLTWNMAGSTGNVTTPASSTAAISYKAGIPNASPAAPPTTTGYVKIAEVLVNATVTSVDANRLKDLRHLHSPFGQRRARWAGNLTVAGPVVTMEQIVAPPGVQMIGTVRSGTAFVYVIAGDLTIAAPIPLVSSLGSAAAEGGDATIVNLTSGEATDLANASISAPAVALAAGQPAIKVQIYGADGRRSVDVAF